METAPLGFFKVPANRDSSTKNPPVVLLHGFASSSADFEETAGLISGFTDAVAFDLPGYGKSSQFRNAECFSISFAVRAIKQSIERLKFDKIILCGYSMGGRTALNCISQLKDKTAAVIIESASPGLAESIEKRDRMASDTELATFIEQKGIKAFEEYWRTQPIFASQEALPAYKKEKVKQQRLACSPETLSMSLKCMGQGFLPDVWNLLPSITVPVLIISGGLDKKYTEIGKRMSELIPDSVHNIVPGAGHNVHLEKPKEFVNLIHEFLIQSRVIDD